ncbi:lipoprotein precursor [Flavobacterium enshiense DK69]|uniref:Lipoprotein n=1 Tax=Flavobacterium enshiense DK69 TaxID=1107311 RepID=V6SEC6_9FLAO|nr:hypothetical protein [Flavobacterium enshiense]ESU24814.1 lipoprotein precursor [Flavobacterium enshiense DK69]KGO96732.1 hypothetical protein Q767_03215 [Flavobacterium enshiense DK69]
MKKRIFLLTAIFSGLLLSCSSDDSTTGNNGNNGGDDNPDTPTFSIPLTTGKFWTYDIKQEGLPNTRDSLYISNDIIIEGNTYKEFKTRDDMATGFYSSSLRNNGVRELNNKLLLSGDLSLAGDGQQLPIGLDLSLLDFVIFKKDATLNEILSTKSGSFQQDFEGYPLTITYSLKSKGGQSFPTFTSPNADHDVYTNVKTSKIVLNVGIKTVIGGYPITVLQPQDVVTSVQYLSDGIGVVYTKTVTTYTLTQAAATMLNIPQTNTQTQEEFLDTHN